MNRRQFLAWLPALPFVPAALARAKQSFTPPSTLYAALAEPGLQGVSGGGYARVAVSSSLSTWAGSPIRFPVPSAAWGEIVGFHLFQPGWPYPLDPDYKPNLPEWF